MIYLLIILIILAGVIAGTSIKIVQQSRVGLVERLGKYNREIKSGVNFVLPILNRIATYVDLRTQVIDSEPQPVITKDNVAMNVDTVVYYRITDSFKAVYEIHNLKTAILNITVTTLRDVIGSLELDQTYTSREQINNRLRVELDEATDAWGVKIERVEVKNINPPADIKEAMEKQMRAEREKRATILQAEGQKESAIRKAEGEREAQILKADGEKQAKIKQSEGEARAIELVAHAEKEQINLVYGALKQADLDATILSLESIKALEKVAQSENNMVIPYEAIALMGSVTSIKDMISKK